MTFKLIPAFVAVLTPCALAQTPASGCQVVSGSVRDATDALIPGATLRIDGGATRRSGADGRFSFPCVAAGSHRLHAEAEGFAAAEMALNAARAGDLRVRLTPKAVDTTVTVDAGDAELPTHGSTAAAQTIQGKELAALADDPDDLLRELQQLGAMSGANPANTTISVNGFQDSTKLPPKSSIAYIEVNPDLFSAEYREPPFGGGRVNVYTKPGQTTYHGALFATNGSPWMNARDPFSLSRAAIGKQRYGAEFSGPLRGRNDKTADFALTLEHRSIDDFAVVNAFVPGTGGTAVQTIANVATPQRLWVGEARVDWQLGAKNTLIASFDTSTGSLQNVGVGGLALAETGYGASQWDNIARFVDITTISPHLMHEAHVSLRWDGETDAPNSTSPSINVSGNFTGGGSTYGARGQHELKTEIDDDAILTTRHHNLKFGTQMLISRERDQLTTGFTPSYTFASLPDYQATLASGHASANDTVTAVTGSPNVNLTQITDALYIQDDWKLKHGLMVSGGLRYYMVSLPLSLNSVTPRLGVNWAPGKKPWWTLHAHAGLFSDQEPPSNVVEMQREDGVNRITRSAYAPAFNTAHPGTGDLFAGTTPITTYRAYAPHFSLGTWAAEGVGGTIAAPKGWNLSWDLFEGRLWNQGITLNINTPLAGNPYGARPIAPNTNILQLQAGAQGHVDAELFFVQQSHFKRVQGFAGVVHIDIFEDNDDNSLDQPQSAYSRAGEFSRRARQTPWNVFGNGSLTLPGKVQWTVDLNAGGRSRYNITTGFDNNGDGNYNDRPQYAKPGQAGAVPTRYGLLIASGGTGTLPRNEGIMPWTVHFDSNVQRAFSLSRNPKAEHPQTLTVNVRSSNVLNHGNVTGVGGVLGSPFFGVAYSADNGRRVEGGVRYSF